MDIIRLQKLELKNFKGLVDFTLDPAGEVCHVHGANATGKSTLADAWSWLLTGKDSRGQADFDIKPLDEAGKVQHGLETSVTAVLDISGQELRLKKTYAEKWTKKRGQARKTLTGHVSKYFLDDVPCKKKEFEARIAGLVPGHLLPILSSPTYFNEKPPWQKRRALLMDLAPDISDQDVIDSQEELRDLPDVLEGRSVEDTSKMLREQLKAVQKKLQEIPARIGELENSLNATSAKQAFSPKEITTTIKKTETALSKKQEALAQLQAGGRAAEIKKHLAEVETKLIDLKRSAQADDSTYRQHLEAGRKVSRLVLEHGDLNKNIEKLEEQKDEVEEKIEALRQQWFEIDSEKFQQPEIETVCPACNQPLSADKIEAAKKEAAYLFNQRKASRLEEINRKGLDLKKELETLQARIEESKEKSKALLQQMDSAREEARKLAEQIADGKDIENTPEYKKLAAEKQELQQQLKACREDSEQEVVQAEMKIQTLQDKLSELREAQAALKQQDGIKDRIEQLKQQETNSAREYEDLERKQHLCNLYTRQKVKLLEDQISEKFRLVRFKLFQTQVNGEIAECCEATVDGVPYDSLNTAARINAGLDIINTLATHHGTAMPIFIDGAESVTDLMATEAQQIRLVVDAGCPELTVKKGE